MINGFGEIKHQSGKCFLVSVPDWTAWLWFLRHTLLVFTGLGRCPIVSWDLLEQ